MKAIKEMLMRLFIPGYTDRKVQAIHHDTEVAINDINLATDRFNGVLEQNGFTMQIYVAVGGSAHKKGGK